MRSTDISWYKRYTFKVMHHNNPMKIFLKGPCTPKSSPRTFTERDNEILTYKKRGNLKPKHANFLAF